MKYTIFILNLQFDFVIMQSALIEPSSEQRLILDSVAGANVCVNAVAGSGKTTTSLHIIRQEADKQILVLTYNARLKIETREKLEKYEMENAECHSYHSFGAKYYDQKCYTDIRLYNIIHNDLRSVRFSYDIIIVDEAQDVTDLYFELINMIVCSNDKAPQFVVMGDINQSIYSYNGADSRFLSRADCVFTFNDLPWKYLKLSISYRLTKQMAEFLNEGVLNENRIIAIKDGSPVKYTALKVHWEYWDRLTAREIQFKYWNKIPIGLTEGMSRMYREIKKYCESSKYTYEDIFILGPSVRSEITPIRTIANLLSIVAKYPIYVSGSDNEALDREIIAGKIVCCTYHQTKGLERKIVIVVGVDGSYTKYFDRSPATKLKCSNAMYVALTRSTEILSIYQDEKAGAFKYFNIPKILACCKVRGDIIRTRDELRETRADKWSVTDFLRHVSFSATRRALEFLTQTIHQEPSDIIELSAKTQQGDLYENVADINGTAVLAYHNYLAKGSCIVSSEIKNTSDLLEKTMAYLIRRNDYIYPEYQITRFNWVTSSQMNDCIKRLDTAMGRNVEYETPLVEAEKTHKDKRLCGEIDAIDYDKSIVWEIKCKKTIAEIDIIQLALYKYLLNNNDIDYSHYYLFNIVDNQLIEVTATYEQLKQMYVYLIEQKNGHNVRADNEFFDRIAILRG